MRKKNTIKYILKAVIDEHFTEICFSKSRRGTAEERKHYSCWALEQRRAAALLPRRLAAVGKFPSWAAPAPRTWPSPSQRMSHWVFEAFPPVLPDRSWCFPNQGSHKTCQGLAFNSYPSLQQQGKPFFEFTRTASFASSKNSSLISDEDNKNPIFKQKALYAINMS